MASPSNNTSTSRTGISLLLMSPIPVVISATGEYLTLDLWVLDIQAQLETVSQLCIVCPESEKFEQRRLMPIPAGVKVVTHSEIDKRAGIKQLVKSYDVTQIYNGADWEATLQMKFLREARLANRCVILGISSNRAKLTILNAENSSLVQRFKSHLKAWSIKHTTKKMAKSVTGVFVVGQGVVDAFNLSAYNLHVSTASWISEGALLPESSLLTRISEYQRS
jgi:hypothetical protein